MTFVLFAWRPLEEADVPSIVWKVLMIAGAPGTRHWPVHALIVGQLCCTRCVPSVPAACVVPRDLFCTRLPLVSVSDCMLVYKLPTHACVGTPYGRQVRSNGTG